MAGFLGLVRRGRAAHHEDDTANRGKVGGYCNSPKCVGNYRYAEYIAFYNRTIQFRCDKCGTESVIRPGDPELQPGALFYPDDPGLRRPIAPYRNDEDAEHNNRDYTDFNRRNGKAYGRHG